LISKMMTYLTRGSDLKNAFEELQPYIQLHPSTANINYSPIGTNGAETIILNLEQTPNDFPELPALLQRYNFEKIEEENPRLRLMQMEERR